MEHICQTLSSYDSLYKKKSYGIDCPDCELEQREQALFYAKSKISNESCNLDGLCIACGIDNNLSYNCSYLTIVNTGTNHLFAEIKGTTYCYHTENDKYTVNFILGITFDNPATVITASSIPVLYPNGDTKVIELEKLYDLGDGAYKYSVEFANNALSENSVQIHFTISDTYSIIHFIRDVEIDKTCII